MPSLGGDPTRQLSVGELAARSGVSVSALHFYEREGLLQSERNDGNQRRYRRDALRRVSFIKVSQRVGVSLADIRAALDSLPGDRAPSPRDWARISERWRAQLDARIAELQHLRTDLDGCMGCGCLSLGTCSLRNPGDELGVSGSGPRRWLEPGAGGTGAGVASAGVASAGVASAGVASAGDASTGDAAAG
ncbi:redox-sensitive transcriptional activator SoxR [Microterricola pindariensis]|uniref:Redox-sensitive transcriptional activator SoxR n=1 Tax=Microterricola pindariensis TaxID=478010 RepID=A0ABX5AYK4_9MICO|nr:redox-sensitive transcriptional activator SoxR [Microterricola pindariensis]PPL19479.1 redox-sensitive transcriptional activator SoxR [Microterricola pindariensis]